MNIFDFRNQLLENYSQYVTSFIQIQDPKIKGHVEQELNDGVLWPDPLMQLNPAFEQGGLINDFANSGLLHNECKKIFRRKTGPDDPGRPLRLYKHQVDAIQAAKKGHSYILTTGTGSGKSLAYIIPIVDHILQKGTGHGIQAIIVYPMNALANSQSEELTKYLCYGYPDQKEPVTFRRYTGQDSDEIRNQIIANPPDILLTNYVMLELLLTRPGERQLIQSARGLRFLVLDELHTYRGRQGADVAMLVRRVRDIVDSPNLQCVGTSATIAGAGTHDEQKVEVAEVTSKLFGTQVFPENVITETIRRITPLRNLNDPTFVNELTQRISDPGIIAPLDYQGFINDPLSIWLEDTFGIRKEPGTDLLIRTQPLSVTGQDGAADKLSKLTGVSPNQCARAIQEGLLAGYKCEKDPETDSPPFAFRLHQFISRGSTVYASLNTEPERHITTNGQQYVPGDRTRVLFPLVFCRECGQEYLTVWMSKDPDTGKRIFSQRQLTDFVSDEDKQPGFIYFSTDKPWPQDDKSVLERLPDDWIEDSRIKNSRNNQLPRLVRIGRDGKESDDGLECHYLPERFHFCLQCGVAYDMRQRSDLAKLSELGFGGRSTATTIMSLYAIRGLRDSDLPKHARKLLSFTDNRQDASLQAGHFNDFVEMGQLRSAIYGAIRSTENGVRHDELTQKVFDALNLPIEMYAVNPEVRFHALTETQESLRKVLGYKIYRDLKRGWRIVAPNLEQCGLLEIKYLSLEELSEAEDIWRQCHPALASANMQTRMKIAKTLLDYMRRELAIKVNYLDPVYQEQIRQQSNQRIIAPWAIDDNEKLEFATTLYPTKRDRHEGYRGYVYLSTKSGFGQYLRRNTTFSEYPERLSLDDTDRIIRELLSGLREAGLVDIVDKPNSANDVPGYQLPASAMIWTAGDGTKPFHDPIRVPNQSETGGRTNPFFVKFYSHVTPDTIRMESREHTAQVQTEDRIDREKRFREGDLPILYCSPTMELGVDIKELNVVNMRNVPPTPANYAQRSGRAGRSGQPALVYSYCSTGSPHDQYFFKRPERMVAGAVTPPRIDLTNEELMRAHIHAIWLTESKMSLGRSLNDILDLSLAPSSLLGETRGDSPTLELLDSVKSSINNKSYRQRTRERAERILQSISDELKNADWYHEKWLDDVLDRIPSSFEQACDRWRGLYRSALSQAKAQTEIILNASRSQSDKNEAKRLRQEAESQLRLLTEIDDLSQSDFYSYRYFASEGFLPGYNFPRLPLSAYIPGRRNKRDDMISRPRFLAITEFGPRSVIYHEGSRYSINKAILPVMEADIATQKVKLCEKCGYLHPITEGDGLDLCMNCKNLLGQPIEPLFRLQNVATQRRDRINCDEEERLRFGYEIMTGVRFAEYADRPSSHTATLEHEGKTLAHLTYGQAANIWRINLGWIRRKNKDQYGFMLDMERGYWQKNENAADEEPDDPMSQRIKRVIPYVEDHKNCLIFKPTEPLDKVKMATLESALKNAIQTQFQLEDNEIAAEPLPSSDERNMILFYESAEGGAGVLRQLLEDKNAFQSVAVEALRLCHFDPQGEDLRHAPRSREDCEAACYDCLMNYTNQRVHPLLDRKSILDILIQLTHSTVSVSPGEKPRDEHLTGLMNLAQSDLERKWLVYMEEHDYRLPSKAQAYVEACKTRPDFFYEDQQTAIYVDGPYHDFPDRQKRDADQTDCMEDQSYTVIRFGYEDDWDDIISRYPYIFGK